MTPVGQTPHGSKVAKHLTSRAQCRLSLCLAAGRVGNRQADLPGIFDLRTHMTTTATPEAPTVSSPVKPITILLTDDQLIIRNGLRALLEDESDMQVVGEAENGQEAVDKARKLIPDVVVMDLAMPVLSGLEATRLILQALPGTKVIIFSSYTDLAYLEEVIKLGASGCLVKHSASRDLPKAIREVYRGGTFFAGKLRRPS